MIARGLIIVCGGGTDTVFDMVRAPCGSGGGGSDGGGCDEQAEKVALRRGPWTPDEDRKLVAYIEQHGHGSWRALPKNAGGFAALIGP